MPSQPPTVERVQARKIEALEAELAALREQVRWVQSKTFAIENSGDSAVGIGPMYEEVFIGFKYGNHDEDLLTEVADAIAEMFDAKVRPPGPLPGEGGADGKRKS